MRLHFFTRTTFQTSKISLARSSPPTTLYPPPSTTARVSGPSTNINALISVPAVPQLVVAPRLRQLPPQPQPRCSSRTNSEASPNLIEAPHNIKINDAESATPDVATRQQGAGDQQNRFDISAYGAMTAIERDAKN
jgi:hypothetical protein